MGFFKWLDKHIRESNEFEREWSSKKNREYKEKQEEKRSERESRKKSLVCCANCRYNDYYGMYGCKYINDGTNRTGKYDTVCEKFEYKD